MRDIKRRANALAVIRGKSARFGSRGGLVTVDFYFFVFAILI